MPHDAQKEWARYREEELALVTPLLTELGYTLSAEQPHLYGERFLMQAVTTESGRKLILLGTRISDGTKVVIKTTADPGGVRELTHERIARQALHRIRFAYRVFATPEELFFGKRGGRTISIQRFIEQESSFLERPLKEQFDFALEAFKAQEGAHAATYEQAHTITKTFGTMNVEGYLSAFARFRFETNGHIHDAPVDAAFARADERLLVDAETIDQYANFLTHTDFLPHNFRISGDTIYLLDHSSFRFGNKYEGWARFLNFMTLYNRDLEQALVTYVRENRTEEESRALSLMRMYRLGELISYHARNTTLSSGDLKTLSLARVHFWTAVLEALLAERPVVQDVIDSYTKLRDQLRSDEEKRRQQGLH